VGFVLESLSPFVSSGVIVRRQKLAPEDNTWLRSGSPFNDYDHQSDPDFYAIELPQGRLWRKDTFHEGDTSIRAALRKCVTAAIEACNEQETSYFHGCFDEAQTFYTTDQANGTHKNGDRGAAWKSWINNWKSWLSSQHSGITLIMHQDMFFAQDGDDYEGIRPYRGCDGYGNDDWCEDAQSCTGTANQIGSGKVDAGIAVTAWVFQEIDGQSQTIQKLSEYLGHFAARHSVIAQGSITNDEEKVEDWDFDDAQKWTAGSGCSVSNSKASWDGTQTAASDCQANSNPLVQNELDQTYRVRFNISGRTAGQIKVCLGDDDTDWQSDNDEYEFDLTPSSSGSLILKITADSDFDGSIDYVSVDQDEMMAFVRQQKNNAQALDDVTFTSPCEGLGIGLAVFPYDPDADLLTRYSSSDVLLIGAEVGWNSESANIPEAAKNCS